MCFVEVYTQSQHTAHVSGLDRWIDVNPMNCNGYSRINKFENLIVSCITTSELCPFYKYFWPEQVYYLKRDNSNKNSRMNRNQHRIDRKVIRSNKNERLLSKQCQSRIASRFIAAFETIVWHTVGEGLKIEDWNGVKKRDAYLTLSAVSPICCSCARNLPFCRSTESLVIDFVMHFEGVSFFFFQHSLSSKTDQRTVHF